MAPHAYGPEHVRPLEPRDAHRVRDFNARYSQSPIIVTRARRHDAAELPGFLIEDQGKIAGVITLNAERKDCEVVTIDADGWGRGIGSALLTRAEAWAHDRGCERMWLVT